MATKPTLGRIVSWGDLLCLKGVKTENGNGDILMAGRQAQGGPKLQVHPSFGRREKYRHEAHRFSLWGNSVWSHCQEKICQH